MRYFLAFVLQIFSLTGSMADTSDLTSLETLDQGRDWMAVGRLSYKNGQSFCTATLVAPDLILTASHCVYDLNPENFLTLVIWNFRRVGETDEPRHIARSQSR